MSPYYQRVAVVTGANRGIGYHIAQQLVTSGLFGTVVLGCRDAVSGQRAAIEVGGTFLQQLDVASLESSRSFAEALRSRYGRLDVLVNNAGTAFKAADPTPFADQTQPTLQTNFYGTVALTEALLPLLRQGCVTDGRVVNVASMAGKLRQLSPERQAQASAESLTLGALRGLVDEFAADAAAGVHADRGWSGSNYGVSKLALIAATRVLARDEPTLKINSCCPGCGRARAAVVDSDTRLSVPQSQSNTTRKNPWQVLRHGHDVSQGPAAGRDWRAQRRTARDRAARGPAHGRLLPGRAPLGMVSPLRVRGGLRARPPPLGEGLGPRPRETGVRGAPPWPGPPPPAIRFF